MPFVVAECCLLLFFHYCGLSGMGHDQSLLTSFYQGDLLAGSHLVGMELWKYVGLNSYVHTPLY